MTERLRFGRTGSGRARPLRPLPYHEPNGPGACSRDHLEPPGGPMINTPDRQNNRKIVAMDDTLADPLAGRLLDGRYAVTARIAHGGMATVYRATDTRLDREVALKVMHAELARDEEFVRRFKIGRASCRERVYV